MIVYFLEYFFWISCFIIFYNYIGYAIIAYCINLVKKRKAIPDTNDFFPTVSFIVAAYNEEDCIETKIINSLEQAYPSDKIEYLFITDGSSDSTPDIIRSYPSIRLLHSEERKGKSAALNRAVQFAKNQVLIFSDANTILNKQALRNLTKHYIDDKVGGVSGEKKVLSVAEDPENLGNTEGLYWKYESFLKKVDSEFYSVVGAAGELFSVRRELYEQVPQDVILDDFIISMRIALKGYRIIYEPGAFASELPSFSLQDEKNRKVRIAAGGFQAIAMLPEAFRFWAHFRLSYLYISHRVLRWALSPFCLLAALVTNLCLMLYTESDFYTGLFILQALFYISGLLGAFSNVFSIKIAKLAYYFIFMNISVIQGFFRFLRRKQSSTWEKAKRSNSSVLENQALVE